MKTKIIPILLISFFSFIIIDLYINFGNLNDFRCLSNHSFSIPGLEDGYVPQGICALDGNDVFLISCYNKDKASSVIYLVNRSLDIIKKTYLYNSDNSPFTGHVGGIASNGTWVWICSENEIYTINYDLLESSNDTIQLTTFQSYPICTSYLYWDGNSLWVGEYFQYPFYPVNQKHRSYYDTEKFNALSLCYGVDMTTGLTTTLKSGLYVPNKVQGMVVLNDSIILSESFWSFEKSAITKYSLDSNSERSGEIEIANQTIPVSYLSSDLIEWSLPAPPMAEGISIIDNKCYVLFESGSDLYKWYTLNRINDVIEITIDSVIIKGATMNTFCIISIILGIVTLLFVIMYLSFMSKKRAQFQKINIIERFNNEKIHKDAIQSVENTVNSILKGINGWMWLAATFTLLYYVIIFWSVFFMVMNVVIVCYDYENSQPLVIAFTALALFLTVLDFWLKPANKSARFHKHWFDAADIAKKYEVKLSMTSSFKKFCEEVESFAEETKNLNSHADFFS